MASVRLRVKLPPDSPEAAASAQAIVEQQLRRAVVLREVDRMRRAMQFWQRQREGFLDLLVQSMDEFGIADSELAEARRLREEGQSAARVSAPGKTSRRARALKT